MGKQNHGGQNHVEESGSVTQRFFSLLYRVFQALFTVLASAPVRLVVVALASFRELTA
jgi:hypothetical protein